MDQKFGAFVYGWRNVVNGKMYIGFKLSSDIYVRYEFSSEDEELREAWSLGLLRRSILFTGSRSDAITMERKLLKYADARRNENWYNKSNGGGAGIRDYHTITDEEAKVGIDWINGIDPQKEKKDLFEMVDEDLVRDIWESVKNGDYEVKEISVEEIKTYEHNQVRLVMIDHNHVKNIAEKMRDNPAEARQQVSPIVVIVYPDGRKVIADGNHTSYAIAEAGWTSSPVIFINSSDFKDNQSNIDKFGIIANYNPKLKKPNSSQDAQRAIINLYYNNLKDLDDDSLTLLQSEKFQDSVQDTLYPEWTRSQISANLKSAIVRIRNDVAAANMNFQTYSQPDRDKIMKKMEEENIERRYVSITSGASYNSGVGAIMNGMAQDDKEFGTILIHHAGIHEYDSWSDSEEKLKKVLDHFDLHDKINYRVLDPFMKEV